MPEKPDLLLVREAEPASDQETVSLYDDEKQYLDNAKLRLQNALLQTQIDDSTQDRTQRKKYSNRLFWLIVGWLGVINAIILLHGFVCVPFHLSVPVLTTIVGSTTVSVLGLFGIVAKYLFPKR